MQSLNLNDYFYHVTGSLLDVGSKILPGSFGELITCRYGIVEPNFGHPYLYFYEQELERCRAAHFPKKPSRFKCVFLCHTEENLRKFITFSGRHGQFGYVVKIDNENGTKLLKEPHIADWEKYDTKWAEQGNWRTRMNEKVENYWKGYKDTIGRDSPIEILVESSITVCERIY